MMGEGISHTRAWRAITLTLACLILMAAVGWLLQGQEDTVAHINKRLQVHRMTLSTLRIMLVLGAIWHWNKIGNWLYPANKSTVEQKRESFRKQRWRFLGAFAFIEVFIANNIFGNLVGVVI
jgi:thiol:disulfide interchange protein